MAFLPDNAFFGMGPSADEQAFWLDGPMQGRAPPAGDAESQVWTEGAASFEMQGQQTFDALKQAQADAEYLTRIQEAHRAMGQVNDPADVRAYEPILRAANEARAVVFTDPAYADLWARERDIKVKRLISKRFYEVSREQTLANTEDWLNRLNASALQVSGQEAVPLIDAGTRLMQGLKESGLVNEAAVQAKREHWLQTYVEARIKQLPPAEQLAALADVPLEDDIAQSQGGVEQSFSLRSVLRPETRARLQHEAQSELERRNTEQVFARAQHYEEGFDRALNDGAPLPSRDDIVFDPALDALSRARLEQRREAVVKEFENYEGFKAKFDDANAGSFDLADPDTRKFVDRIYRARGANDAALYVVVRRAGILPSTARNAMLGDLASGDPERVKRSVEAANWINDEFPSLLSVEEDGEKLLNAVTQFRHETGRGASAEEAIKQITKSQSSEYEKNSGGRQNSADVAAAVEKAISVFDLIGLHAAEPEAAASMFSVYADLVKERYAATDDMSLAKAQARALLESRWNLTSQADPSSRSDPEKEKPPTWLELLGETWPGQAVKSAYSGFTLAGDVFAGRVKTEDELMERVFDMAGLITGGSFVRPQRAEVGEVILGMGATRGARRVRPIVDQSARFGTSTSKEYRTTFFKSYKDVPRDTVVHHAVEQRTLKMYPGLISESEMHSLQNLRGIPYSKNNELHLSQIRKEWDDFYLKNLTTTKRKLLNKAMEIDRKYGSQFIPPLKFSKQKFI